MVLLFVAEANAFFFFTNLLPAIHVELPLAFWLRCNEKELKTAKDVISTDTELNTTLVGTSTVAVSTVSWSVALCGFRVKEAASVTLIILKLGGHGLSHTSFNMELLIEASPPL